MANNYYISSANVSEYQYAKDFLVYCTGWVASTSTPGNLFWAVANILLTEITNANASGGPSAVQAVIAAEFKRYLQVGQQTLPLNNVPPFASSNTTIVPLGPFTL
jgi:hypothetical protein